MTGVQTCALPISEIVYKYGINFLIKVSEPPMNLAEPKLKKVGLVKRGVKQFLGRNKEIFN